MLSAVSLSILEIRYLIDEHLGLFTLIYRCITVIMLPTSLLELIFFRSLLRRSKFFFDASLGRYRLIISRLGAALIKHFGLRDCPAYCWLLENWLSLSSIIIFETIIELVTIVIEHIGPVVIILIGASQWVKAYVFWLWFSVCLLLFGCRRDVFILLLILTILRFRLVLRMLLFLFVICLLRGWRGVIDNNLPV